MTGSDKYRPAALFLSTLQDRPEAAVRCFGSGEVGIPDLRLWALVRDDGRS